MSNLNEDLDAIERAVTNLRGRLERSAAKAGLLSIAQRLREARVARDEGFPAGMFADPAWDLLLGTFIAGETEWPLTKRALIDAAGLPYSTGNARVEKLTEDGWLTSRPSCPAGDDVDQF